MRVGRLLPTPCAAIRLELDGFAFSHGRGRGPTKLRRVALRETGLRFGSAIPTQTCACRTNAAKAVSGAGTIAAPLRCREPSTPIACAADPWPSSEDRSRSTLASTFFTDGRAAVWRTMVTLEVPAWRASVVGQLSTALGPRKLSNGQDNDHEVGTIEFYFRLKMKSRFTSRK